MQSVWYLSIRETGVGEREGCRKEGNPVDKGALHAELAHIEAETDKVTQSGVALTERESQQECTRYYSIYLLL